MQPRIKSAASFTGNPDDCTALFLFGGDWFAPNKDFRRLLGDFGESLVRTIVSNSSRPVCPATLSPETADIIRKVCEQTKSSKETK
jgi:hypothetical protein